MKTTTYNKLSKLRTKKCIWTKY